MTQTSNSSCTVTLFAILWGITFARVPPEDLIQLDETEKPLYVQDGMRIYLGPWGPCEALPSEELSDTTTPYYYGEKELNKRNDTSRHVGHIGDFQQVNGGAVGGRARPHSLTFEPKVGQQRRKLDCFTKNGIRLDISQCPSFSLRSIASLGSVRACIVSEDCALGEWSSWRPEPDSSGGLVRTRALLNMPQGDGAVCGPLEARQGARADEEVRWSGAPWGPCQVANASGYVPAQTLPLSSSTSSCGGGVQHRSVWCVRARDGLVVPDARCAARPDVLHVSNVQPCEVPCPRDCEVGPWSSWSPCRPLGECPLFPVQEVTSTGYSVRRRRVSVAGSSDGGASCGALAETRACPRPRCARWLPAAWGPCRLPAGASCGTGRRTRDIHCLDHDGRPAAESWCGAGGWTTDETCRIACAGDCVLSAWGAWGECEGPCAKPHEEPPRRTRRRYVLAEASPKGWSCPTAEQLEQSEPCNEHSCHSHSWLTLPWGDCEAIPNENENQINSSMDAADSCHKSGTQTREVWCMQDNDNRVKDVLCVPLSKPHIQRECLVHCAPATAPLDVSGGCVVGPWGEWSPCPDTCETSTQSRTRVVESGCAAPSAQWRVCPPRCAAPPPVGAQWAVGAWRDCRLPIMPDTPCGVGIKTRPLWCSLGAHRVDARACLSSPVPPVAAPCRVKCEDGLIKNVDEERAPTCEQLCNNTHSLGESWDALVGAGCKCPGFYLELLSPASDCILPPGESCGSGRRLQAAVCLGPHGERPVDFAVCRRHVDTPVHPLSGLKYEDSIPGLVWRGCSVSCPRDCVLSAWSEWGACRADRTNATYHYRTRSVISVTTAGGRPCGPLVQRRACSLAPPRWTSSAWGPCSTPRRTCGTGLQRRKVWCEDPRTSLELPLSACLSGGPPPPVGSPCRAPCPHDCVFSAWSDWSPCIKTSGGRLQRDRTRVILRASRGSGRGCTGASAALVEAASCERAHTYSWVIDPFDDCQPLGGSPCGEGTQSSSARCVREDGHHVDDILCSVESRPLSSSLSKFCFIPCSVDCAVSAWSSWNKDQCECGTDAAQLSQRIVRTRRVITPSSGEGRACPAEAELRQTAPCPRGPCYNSTVKRLPGCRLVMHDGSLALPYDVSACGHGVSVTELRCDLADSQDDTDYSDDSSTVKQADSSGLSAPRALCVALKPGHLSFVPPERTYTSCVVSCGPCDTGLGGRRPRYPCRRENGLQMRRSGFDSRSAFWRRCGWAPPISSYDLLQYANCSVQRSTSTSTPAWAPAPSSTLFPTPNRDDLERLASVAADMPEYGPDRAYILRSWYYGGGNGEDGGGHSATVAVAVAGLVAALVAIGSVYGLIRLFPYRDEGKLSTV